MMTSALRKRLIQAVLIERQRIGETLLSAREQIEEGSAAPSVAAAVNLSFGKMQAWLWALREAEPEPARFASLLETLGFRADDEEVRALAEIDTLLEQWSHLAGEIAAGAVAFRDGESSL